MTTYAVFLRGINVGGINIKMADLRKALSSLPLRDVSTLLATGNILCASEAGPVEVKNLIETCLRDNFGYDAWVVVLTAERLAELVEACPYPGDSKEMHAYITLTSDIEMLDELYQAAGGEANAQQYRLGAEAMARQVQVGKTLDSEINKLTAKAKYKRTTTTRNLRTLIKVRDAAQAHRSFH
ncbi:DUF1697 domain-containing protein [Arthrobacter sp. H14]|uniref:DUF1697 domain-containing protein n=1 Tax=Arthrobacter sp. H14 TaxID=1312959 RepID=UPI00047EF4F9|nr:DUF1697 domain-containing protein [Arthrobacter sp. H14]